MLNIKMCGVCFLLFGWSVVAQNKVFLNDFPCPNQQWHLAFSDDFDGNAIDTTKWYTYIPQWPNYDDKWEFGRTHGKEGQIYKNENVQVKNGYLYLILKNEPSRWYTANRAYSSGLIYSNKNFVFKYGKFETRCKIPKGTSLWSAFWLWGGDEIDIFEFNTDANPMFSTDIHTNEKHKNKFYMFKDIDLSSDFHTYTLEWDENYMKWLLDGKEIRTVWGYLKGRKGLACGNSIKPKKYKREILMCQKPLHIIANVAVSMGGQYGGPPNKSTPKYAEMIIDYIKVYKRK